MAVGCAGFVAYQHPRHGVRTTRFICIAYIFATILTRTIFVCECVCVSSLANANGIPGP